MSGTTRWCAARYGSTASRSTRRRDGNTKQTGFARSDGVAAGVPAGGATTEPAATTPAATPAPTPTPTPAPASASASAAPASASAPAGGDDLTRIKGLGPKLSATLHGAGVTSFAQIAAWSDADIDRIDAQLGRFQGRIRRDDWVGQAKLLAQGDENGFAERYGKLS